MIEPIYGPLPATVESLLEEIADPGNWCRDGEGDLVLADADWDPRALAREALALLCHEGPPIFAELDNPIKVVPPMDIEGMSIVIVKLPSNCAIVRRVFDTKEQE